MNCRQVTTPSITTATLLACALLLPCRAAADYGSQFDGFVTPLHQADLAFAETGVLQGLHVAVGDRVQKGALLASLDREIQESLVRIAESQAAREGERRAAKAEYNLRVERFRQLQILHETEMAQSEELKRAEADAEIAASRFLAAREDLELRQLELERARLQLARRSLKAPFDGVVTTIFRQVGEYVPPNDPVVLRFIAEDVMVAVVNVPAELLPHCKAGTAVRVRTTAPAATYNAHVLSVSPAIDGESGTVRVRARFDNPNRTCRAGDRCTIMFARGTLKAASSEPAEVRVQR